MSDPYVQRTAATGAVTSRTPDVYYDVDATNVVTPTDRVRWASVLAGIFTTLASLIVFTVLGIAIGAAAFDPNEPSNLGLGTGIYSIITGILSFLFGGFVAARSAAVAGRNNGLLNGAMVWIVTTVLVLNMLGAGLGTLIGATTSAAADAAAEVAGQVANQAVTGATGAAAVGSTGAGAADAGTTGADTTGTAGGDTTGATVGDQAAAAANQIQNQVANVPDAQVEQAADTVSRGAWMALLAMGLTAGAAILGGVMGARPRRSEMAA